MFRAPSWTSRAPACLLKLAGTGFSMTLDVAKYFHLQRQLKFLVKLNSQRREKGQRLGETCSSDFD